MIEAVDEGGSLKGMQNFGFKEEKMKSKFKFYQFGSKITETFVSFSIPISQNKLSFRHRSCKKILSY